MVQLQHIVPDQAVMDSRGQFEVANVNVHTDTIIKVWLTHQMQTAMTVQDHSGLAQSSPHLTTYGFP